MECHTIEKEWQLQRDAPKGAKTRIPKKQQLPAQPKRLIKLRLPAYEEASRRHEDNCDKSVTDDMQEEVEQMRTLEIQDLVYFTSVCSYFPCLPFY